MDQMNVAQYRRDPNPESGASVLDRSPDDNQPRRPVRKRQRIPSACEPCRRRKTRCDGSRPVCSLCLRRSSSNCVYRRESRDQAKDLSGVAPSITDSTGRNWGVPPSSRERHSDNATHLPSASRVRDTNTTSASRISQPNRLESLTVTSYLDSRKPSPSNEFYGSSTTAKLMHQVQGSANPTTGSSKHIPGLKGGPPPGKSPTASTSGNFASMDTEHLQYLALPTRDLADILLDTYWTKVYPVSPIVYKPAFAAAVEDLWKPRKELRNSIGDFDLGIGSYGASDSRTTLFHCALNAIFAWSCQFAGPTLSREERESLAQTFLLRSKKLLAINLFDNSSVAHVQTLLLFAQCIPSTLFPSACWNVIGLACRTAQGIGLHVERSPANRSPRELEVRRRVWYACMIMDTSYSMVLGRPTMASYQITIPLPTTTEDDVIFDIQNVLESSSQPSHINFMAEIAKLYVTLGKILSNIYKPGPGAANNNASKEEKSESLNIVVALDEDISNWEDNMPSWLHWERGIDTRDELPESQQVLLSKQSNLLHARYLSVRIALHRPTFLRFCRRLGSAAQKNPSTSQTSPGKNTEPFRDFRSSMSIQSSVACITAAIDLVNLSHESTRKNADTSWWFAMQYIINAATILILAESCPPMHYYFNYTEAHSSWLLCCDTLRLLAEAGHPSDNVLNGLYAMRQQLVQSQLPTTRSNTTQDQTPEIGTEGTPIAQDCGSTRLQQQSLSLPAGHEQDSSGFQAGPGVEISSTPSTQPFIDFMMQDTDLMALGFFDQSWLGSPHVDPDVGFDGAMPMSVDFEQDAAL